MCVFFFFFLPQACFIALTKQYGITVLIYSAAYVSLYKNDWDEKVH